MYFRFSSIDDLLDFLKKGTIESDSFYPENIEVENKLKEEDALSAEEDYRGMHQAPGNEGSPLYDLTNTYPDDIYGPNGVQYYGHGIPADWESISVIHSVKNKPNASVRIYRAVPDINFDINKKQTAIQKILSYYKDYNFFPLKNPIIYELQDKYSIDNYEYDEQQRLIVEDLKRQRDELFDFKKDDLTINSGDWVTISRQYAKEHGESSLNNQFKIISKVVQANQLWTDGNSIHEWGYVE